RLRVRAAKRDISAGESVRLDVRFLGDEGLWPITWTADIGAVTAAGVYTAPSSVTADIFARVQACVAPSSCDRLVLGLHPCVIEPTFPAVEKGGRLTLAATLAGGKIAPSWSQLAGGGSLSAAGEYTAALTQAEAGAIPISATYSGGITQKTTVAVTGAFPGLVNPVPAYVYVSNPGPKGPHPHPLPPSHHPPP